MRFIGYLLDGAIRKAKNSEQLHISRMKYEDLINAMRKFHQKFGRNKPEAKIYPESVAPRYINWNNLQSDDMDKIFRFLNVWGRCRLPKRIGNDFLNACRNVSTMLKQFTDLKLESFDSFDQPIDFEDERTRAKMIIHVAFDKLMTVEKIGPTPASKTLHLLAPGFFVMWDGKIHKMHGLRPPNGYNYANIFMPKMREELEEAIRDLMEIKNVDRKSAIKSISNEARKLHGYPKSLAKLIDQFNWVKAHLIEEQ